jgi:cytosine/adenosine deaminase-related metal-dependent hydrolase
VSGLRGFGGAQVIDARNDPDMRRQVLAALHGQGIDVSALAASGTPASPAASAEDPIDRLAKLAEFHDHGLISSAEFDTQKARLLGET